ncbi:hypothetical protein EIP91_009398, partial [Steccherinum ochraceum]
MANTVLPVLALPHPLILLPTARITIPVQRSTGEELLSLVQHAEDQPLIAAVPLTSPDASLHSWGTAARIVRLIRPPARNQKQPFLLTLQGVARIRILEERNTICSDSADGIVERRVEYPEAEGTPAMESIIKFKASALRLLELLAKDTSQQAKRDAYRKIADMLENTTDGKMANMADLLVASVNGEYADKLDFLSASNAEDRLSRATTIFVKQTSITEVSKKIAQSVDDSLSKQQKEFYLRQQLSAIQRELASITRGTSVSNSTPIIPDVQGSGNDAPKVSELDNEEQAEVEEMADIKAKIEAMAKDSEERKMGVREWRRLKRIPQGSVEHGVVRNYLEWLTSVPWTGSEGNASAISMETLRNPAFISNARAQLDADHYGLEKIKKRLIEYLAVVRLKAVQADREQALATSQKSVEASKEPHPSQTDLETNVSAMVPGQEQSPTPSSSTTKPKPSTVKGPILLFIGPPGTGKTSLGQSIARSLNRPFQRISLGGVRDEAEIRGHRRTYVGSGPGLIVQALRKAGRPDPVILLDEIDKVSQSNFHGDPAAALLEVLDPEQNHSFNDHYVNVPIDLSQVLFICTSNSLETISAPLLDRCEIVQLSGYTYDEKVHIARRFLLPKQLTANGLTSEHLELSEDALMHIATMYTREAGVRSLERAIGGVVRYKAVEWAEHIDTSLVDAEKHPEDTRNVIDKAVLNGYKRIVETDELEKILGIARWDADERERDERRGVVYGLVVTGMGEGGILPIETILIPSGSGTLKLTGSLGEVIKESGELALSWVKTHAYQLGITQHRSIDPLKVPGETRDIHLHLPSGAVKKDGPSAGIAMTCAFVSLLTGACVPSDVAMTGEITLRGRVGPVGGIKEKVLGAHRAHIKKVILPWANRKDVEQDVPPEVRSAMQLVFVRTMEETLEAAFGKGVLGWRGESMPVLESRL